MKVLLISGHGAGDSGATGNGYKEFELTRELSKLIQSKLKSYATVVLYPTGRNAYDDVQKGTFTNYVSGGIKSYDYAFEVHFNSSADDTKGDGETTGVEIFISSLEEKHTVEDGILEKVCSLGFENRGVKVRDFSVITTIKNYGVSSALLETCFIDDKDDMDLYQKNKDKYAVKVAAGIAEGFGLKKNESTESKPDSKPTNPVDQVLDVGSKCKFAADYTVEKIDIPNQWVYNSRIGGWIGSAICREIKGGKKVDQCLTVGDHFTIDGTFTVSKIDIPNQRVYLKELGFWVLSESLTEVA